MKHTITPWSIARQTATEKRLLVVHPDGERVIARCDEGWSGNKGEISEGERMANARLISAAPELLDALKLAIEWFEGHYSKPLAVGCTSLQQMKDAVVKATGDQTWKN